jgi:hypothetical protein
MDQAKGSKSLVTAKNGGKEIKPFLFCRSPEKGKVKK